MGHFRHHAIVVTGHTEYNGKLETVHEKAREIFAGTSACVSEITPKGTNGYQSFFVAPDGSKEWWGDSDAGDIARRDFVWFLRQSGIADWVEVQFGDDGGQTLIVNDSSHFPEEDDE